MSLSMESRLGMGLKADIFVLVASWFAFGTFFLTIHNPPALFVFWVLLTTAILMVSLNLMGYFERYTVQPELSGIVSLLLVLPFSAVLSSRLIMWVVKGSPIPYHDIFRISIWVALVFELSQWVTFKLHCAAGRRWVLAACLQPEEMEILGAEIAQSGASNWIRVMPVNPSDGGTVTLAGNETLVISRGAVHDLRDHRNLLSIHLRGQKIVDFRQLLKELRCRFDLRNADAWTFIQGALHQNFIIRCYFHLKAFLEPVLALFLLILLMPLWILIAFGIWVTSGWPVLYRQERLGYLGERFFLLKFRTMSNCAEESGPCWASKDDPRTTAFGRWLRSARLDELPQLLNVIHGELSFVGPRPERPEFYQILNQEIPLFSLRLLVRPGVTGWAQVMQGYAASVDECRTKLEYDLYYVQNMSPRLDLRSLVNTLALIIRGNSGR
jgi:lipopolysaccharide/colanic/teichoic acid biosynthesis glycosyltransferase